MGRTTATGCGQDLPFCADKDEYLLERFRLAVLKSSEGDLDRLLNGVDQAKRDWRDELVWVGFAEPLDTHLRWAEEVLGV